MGGGGGGGIQAYIGSGAWRVQCRVAASLPIASKKKRNENKMRGKCATAEAVMTSGDHLAARLYSSGTIVACGPSADCHCLLRMSGPPSPAPTPVLVPATPWTRAHSQHGLERLCPRARIGQNPTVRIARPRR